MFNVQIAFFYYITALIPFPLNVYRHYRQKWQLRIRFLLNMIHLTDYANGMQTIKDTFYLKY